jgi:dihydroxy-acid dehydratase
VLGLGKTIKDSVAAEGFLAWQFNTIGVSDGITMGHQGKFGKGTCRHTRLTNL